MNKQFPRFTSFLLMCLTCSLTATAQVVEIPDSNLRAAVEKTLGKASGATITAADMAKLPHLEARNANVGDLTGLEGAINLTRLDIGDNALRDISVLAGLTKLTELSLDSNNITDISVLAGLPNLIDLALGYNAITDHSILSDLTKLTELDLRGTNTSDLSVLSGLTKLERLFIDSNGISDLSSLAGLTKLKAIGLNSNSISDLSPLRGLTNLEWLRFVGNNITDLSPLVANTGLGERDWIDVTENPLSHTSIKTHIPTLQSRGVTVEFDNQTPTIVPPTVADLNVGEPHTVRLIYFLPSDRSSQQDIDTKLDTLIRDVQQFYADEMERHSFKGKTFTFETDATGKTVVHHVDGEFTDSYYRQNTFRKVWEEIRKQFHTPHNIYFIAIDIGNERVGRGYNEVCGVGDSHGASSGHVLIPASGDCFNFKTAAHELGHAFGLQHDFRSDTYIMSFGKDPNRLSECAAEWLDAHRYFNTGQSQPHFDNPTKIQMLPSLASPPYAIGLRFEITDPDGVHQAQLLTPATITNQDRGQPKLLSCKRLNGETDTIAIEFITNKLTAERNEVTLSVIDVYGTFTSQTYSIDITTILPAETTSITDKNQVINIPEPVPLPLTVRDAFELDPSYQQWIDVEGLPVVASEKVNPYALKEAAWLIWQMIGHRPDVLQALVQNRVHFIIVTHNELPTLMPKYSDNSPNFLSYKIRGFEDSGLSGHPSVRSSEEQLLRSAGVVIHRFAHKIHLSGLNTIAPAFDNRLKIAYDAAIEKGLWQGTYASSDRREYWAEGTQTWFHPKGGNSSFNGNTRGALKAYDPELAALLAEVHGDTEWRYTPATERTHLPHLQGFDPQDLPTFQEWPGLEELYQQFRNPNSDVSDKWVDLRPYDPNLLPSLNESRTAGPRTTVAFVNLTQADVLLYGVRYDGTERFRTRVPPGYIRVSSPTVNEIRLIKDSNGRNLAVFQAVEKPGRAIVSTEMFLITPGLSKISGDNRSDVSGAVLVTPFVIEVRDENLSVLEGISITFTVVAGDGTLSVTHTITDENGRAQSTLTLGTNLGTNTVEVSAAGIDNTVTFNAVAEAAVDIPDPNLRAAIETALGKGKDDPITPSEMATLPHLEAPEVGILNLTGLEHATHLMELKLDRNSISDISALADLINLIDLHLHRNSVSDLSPLAGLTKLTGLYLGGSSASDLSPLAGLTNLESLFLDSNGIVNLSPLVGLTNLTRLALNNNSVSDLSPLAGLTNLKWMRLAGNNITDLSPLIANTGLEEGDWIDVKENPLNRASIKTHIPALQSRGVTVEFDHSDTESPPITADVNNDGSVNVLDLIVITSNLDIKGTNLAADVNRDGVVNILDLVLAAGMFDVAVAAPAAQPQVPETLTAVEVQGWLTDARRLEVRDPIMKRGFVVLEQLLVSLTPTETELLANYPNPFNPETWIPYRLAEDAFVILTIYDPSGWIVRTFDVGHRIASAYENRSKAIYWDGKNNLGEQVASGVYFYQLRVENSRSETGVGDYSSTRKMIILK